MSNDAVLEQFSLAAEAFENGDFAAAAEGFAEVWRYQRALGGIDLEGEAGTATAAMVLTNLASACQQLAAWDRMHEATSALVEREPAAPHRMLHAIALKHRGGADEALALIRSVVADSPDYGNAHYELANQLLARGQTEDALASLHAAIEAGASVDEISVDPELAALEGHPRFVELTSNAHAMGALGRRIARLHEALVPGELDDAYVERMDEILPLVEELLARMEIAFAERDPSTSRVRVQSLGPDQRAAIEALIACPQLWHAIPFLNLLGEAGLPGLSAVDARDWLDAG